MVTRGSPFSISKLIFRFVSRFTPMEHNPHELPFRTYAACQCPNKRSSTLCFVLAKWSPCRKQEWTATAFLFVLVLGSLETKCVAQTLKAETMSCGTHAAQDLLFKPCRAPTCLRQTAQEHETVSQAGRLFGSMLYVFHGGNLTTTSEGMVSH